MTNTDDRERGIISSEKSLGLCPSVSVKLRRNKQLYFYYPQYIYLMETKKKTESNKECLKLQKAFTYFMIPFHFEGDECVIEEGDDKVWCKANKKFLGDGDDVLFPYINNFLQGGIITGNEIAPSYDHLEIYSINPDDKSTIKKLFDAISKTPDSNNETSNNTDLHFAELKLDDENGEARNEKVYFSLIRDSGYKGFKSPHLFISTTANIGLLTFCIELGGSNLDLRYLNYLNYYLHKIGKPYARCVCPSFQLSGNESFPNEKAKQSREERIKSFRKLIQPHEESSTDYTPYSEFSWNIHTLVELLLKDVKGIIRVEDKTEVKEVNKFSDIRAHLFTFCQINGIETPCQFDDIKADLMRLSRCVNYKYLIDTDEDVAKKMCLQTFTNIHFASSCEGASMIAISNENNKEFISTIDSQGLPRYLAIYLLTLIQRYSMLHINSRLTELCTERGIDTQLWNILNIIKGVKVHCNYTDVSLYSQHNQFYQHCNKNLHVQELFNEIDNKTKILNLTISHETQVLLDEQRKATERVEKKEERRQQRLNWVIGILTVFQVAGVIHQFTQSLSGALACAAFCIIIIIILVKS